MSENVRLSKMFIHNASFSVKRSAVIDVSAKSAVQRGHAGAAAAAARAVAVAAAATVRGKFQAVPVAV